MTTTPTTKEIDEMAHDYGKCEPDCEFCVCACGLGDHAPEDHDGAMAEAERDEQFRIERGEAVR